MLLSKINSMSGNSNKVERKGFLYTEVGFALTFDVRRDSFVLDIKGEKSIILLLLL